MPPPPLQLAFANKNGKLLAKEGDIVSDSPSTKVDSRLKIRLGNLSNRLSFPLLLLPAILIIGIVLLYPLAWAFYHSFFDFSIARPYLGQRFIGFGNYLKAFTNAGFWTSTGLTLALTLTAVGLQVIIGFFLSLLLSRNIRGINFFRTITIIPIFLTPVVVGYIWKFILNVDFGLWSFVLDKLGMKPVSLIGSMKWALPVVALIDVWQHTPFAAFLFLAGLKSLPEEVFEAAKIDGASGLKLLTRITIPLLKPVLLVIISIRSYDVFKTFDTIFVLTGGGPADATKVLSILLYKESFLNLNTGYSLALSWIILMLTLILVSFYYLALRSDE